MGFVRKEPLGSWIQFNSPTTINITLGLETDFKSSVLFLVRTRERNFRLNVHHILFPENVSDKVEQLTHTNYIPVSNVL